MRYSTTVFTAFLFFLIGNFAQVKASEDQWELHAIGTNKPVKQIYQYKPNHVLVKTGTQWFQPIWCKEKLCLKAADAPAIKHAPKGGLQDGGLATHKSNSLRSAWYTDPTTIYGHGILGDQIEAGGLTVKDAKGVIFSYRLPTNSVFEDLTPRLKDLDGDGQPEVITIRSFLNTGGSLAVFSKNKNKLQLTASTPAIGLSHRWLNVAGIDDFNGDGFTDIAIVVTPHIGGTLEIWSYQKDKLIKTASKYGFSNHFIGSRNLGLSAVGDVTGDKIPEIAIPGPDRQQLRIMSLQNGELKQLGSVQTSHRITENIGLIKHPKSGRSAYILGLSNGALVAVSNQ